MSEENKVMELVREAYSLGYFIGLKGHTEWAGWVREKLNDLYEKAEELGIYDLVRKAYRDGKSEGLKRRAEMLNEALGETKEGSEVLKGLRELISIEEGLGEERDYADFLREVEIILPPKLLDGIAWLKPPKILRRGKLGGKID